MKVLKQIVAIVGTLTLLFLGYGMLASSNRTDESVKPGQEISVTIKQGSSAGDIAKALEQKKLIKSAFMFTLYLGFYQQANELKSGSYRIKPGLNYSDLVKVLKEGPKVKTVWVTIPEGLNLRQIAERLARIEGFHPDKFLELASTSSPYKGKYPFLELGKSLEGFIFPDTYELIKGKELDEKLIQLALERYQKVTRGLNWNNSTAKGLSTYQLLTIASMVEREAKLAEERPLISAVIYNRLKIGMPLQIDATVQYALPEWKARLFNSDLQIDSPYNTYKYKGIPPGPISNPGVKSIEAALSPADAPYLYYVLVSENGKHQFATSYDEFLAAKRQAKIYFRNLNSGSE